MLPDLATVSLSVKQLREEIEEFEEAVREGDLVKAIDALIDLQYFHHGIVYKMGVPSALYFLAFSEVHKANMEKQKGVKAERGDYGVPDANKPIGWQPPEEKIRELLVSYGKKAGWPQL